MIWLISRKMQYRPDQIRKAMTDLLNDGIADTLV